MATPLEKFQFYRDEDKHECNLIAARINAFLTSQSLLLTASAILFSGLKNAPAGEQRLVLLPIAGVAIVAATLAEIAIWIGCDVLRQWHRHGTALIADQSNHAPNADNIDGCYLVSRNQPDLKQHQPDLRHRLSVDVFCIGLPVIFIVFWSLVIIGLLWK